ncbi:MAG: hypothetical protein HFJ12_03380 [Bacilli bacterium]|nr:hypothetical protein [Bacilli bacterium]
MDKKKETIDEDMSKTFVGEINQKSAIASDNTVTLENLISSEVKETPRPVESQIIQKIEEQSGQSEPNKKKKRNPFLIILLMLFAFALGGIGTYYYFEIYHTKEEISSNNNEVQEETEKDEEELNPDGVFITNLIERYDAYVITNCEIYESLYNKKSRVVSELDKEEIKYLVAKEALNINRGKNPTYFSSEDFHKAAIRLFGTNLTIEDGNINLYPNVEGAIFTYDKENNQYTYKAPEVGGTTTYTMERKNIKAIRNEESLEVTVAIAILDSNTKKIYRGYNSKATDGSLGIEEVEGFTTDTFTMDKDYSKLDQYRYTFDYDTTNDNYVLTSIELVK